MLLEPSCIITYLLTYFVQLYVLLIYLHYFENIHHFIWRYLILFSIPFHCPLKVPFFRKSDSFSKSPNVPKKLFQKTILSLKFEIPAHISKQLIQISSSVQFFWNNFFGRLGDLKNEFHFLKKSHLQPRLGIGFPKYRKVPKFGVPK